MGTHFTYKWPPGKCANIAPECHVAWSWKKIKRINFHRYIPPKIYHQHLSHSFSIYPHIFFNLPPTRTDSSWTTYSNIPRTLLVSHSCQSHTSYGICISWQIIQEPVTMLILKHQTPEAYCLSPCYVGGKCICHPQCSGCACTYWDCTSVQNFRAIGPLFMEILHFKDLGDTSVISECSLSVNLVIDNFSDVASDTLPLYKIWKQSDHYLWRYYILKIWGIHVSSANAAWVLIQ